MADRYESVVDEAIAKQNGNVSPSVAQKTANDMPADSLKGELVKARQAVRDEAIAFVAGGFIDALESIERNDYGEYSATLAAAVGKFSANMKSKSQSTLSSPAAVAKFALNPIGQ
jgi:hypothetical protein